MAHRVSGMSGKKNFFGGIDLIGVNPSHSWTLITAYYVVSDSCLNIEWLDDLSFASCGADTNIYIMNISETKPLKQLSGHSHEVNNIVCNPTRNRLASCSDDCTARIWNVADITSRSPKPIPNDVDSSQSVVLTGHDKSVSDIRWCPVLPPSSNELVATCSFDGRARLWDSVTGTCLSVFSDHTGPVYALSFSPNGRFLATGGGDGYLHIYDLEAQKKTWSWFAGFHKPGIFELDWQQSGNINRIAMALERWSVGVVDVSRVDALQMS